MPATPINGISSKLVPYENEAPLKVYGAPWCGHCQSTQKNFTAAGLNYKFVDASHMSNIKAYPTLVCRQIHVGEMSAKRAAQWCPVSAPSGKVGTPAQAAQPAGKIPSK